MSIVYELFKDKGEWYFMLTKDIDFKLSKEDVKILTDLNSTIAMTIKILNYKGE
jgi:hypothetical protein